MALRYLGPKDPDHWAKYACDCGEVFYVDATDETNLEYCHVCATLVTICPGCGVIYGHDPNKHADAATKE